MFKNLQGVVFAILFTLLYLQTILKSKLRSKKKVNIKKLERLRSSITAVKKEKKRFSKLKSRG